MKVREQAPPVMDGGHLIGTLTETDVLRAFVGSKPH